MYIFICNYWNYLLSEIQYATNSEKVNKLCVQLWSRMLVGLVPQPYDDLIFKVFHSCLYPDNSNRQHPISWLAKQQSVLKIRLEKQIGFVCKSDPTSGLDRVSSVPCSHTKVASFKFHSMLRDRLIHSVLTISHKVTVSGLFRLGVGVRNRGERGTSWSHLGPLRCGMFSLRNDSWHGRAQWNHWEYEAILTSKLRGNLCLFLTQTMEIQGNVQVVTKLYALLKMCSVR